MTCSCEYPCSCVAEARERELRGRIAELEQSQVASCDGMFRRLAEARERRLRLELECRTGQLHSWECTAGRYRGRAESLERAIRRHRDTAGAIHEAHDLELYRALEKA